MKNLKSRIAIGAISAAFAVYLAQNNLEWLPNWIPLLVMLLGASFWIVTEPLVRDFLSTTYKTETGRILDPTTHKPIHKPRIRKRRTTVSVITALFIASAV